MCSLPLPRPGGRFPERVARCALGLALFGTGIAFFARSNLGVPPWDVFHQGISRLNGQPLGTNIILVSFFVLLLWLPLRIKPGLGTLMNAFEIGFVVNAVQRVLPEPGGLPARWAFVAAGMATIALGSGLYIGARLGSGPRDGLMVGLNARFGVSLRLARTLVEVSVMAIGAAMGGAAGAGTLVFALGIGPLVQVTMRRFGVDDGDRLAALGEALEA